MAAAGLTITAPKSVAVLAASASGTATIATSSNAALAKGSADGYFSPIESENVTITIEPVESQVNAGQSVPDAYNYTVEMFVRGRELFDAAVGIDANDTSYDEKRVIVYGAPGTLGMNAGRVLPVVNLDYSTGKERTKLRFTKQSIYQPGTAAASALTASSVGSATDYFATFTS